jgi:broad specificity phosphatase PhoE
MKKIIVRKIFPYDPTFDGKYSKYEGYALITTQELDPGIISEIYIKVDKSTKIYASYLNRSRQTASAIGNTSGITNIGILKDLAEIKFDLKKLLRIDEYDKYGSILVRQRFVEDFINDDLMEKRVEIKKRIDRILTTLETAEETKILLISHSFFMKIMEVYLNNKDLFTKPRILKDFFDTNKRTFDNGTGFDFYM